MTISKRYYRNYKFCLNTEYICCDETALFISKVHFDFANKYLQLYFKYFYYKLMNCRTVFAKYDH